MWFKKKSPRRGPLLSEHQGAILDANKDIRAQLNELSFFDWSLIGEDFLTIVVPCGKFSEIYSDGLLSQWEIQRQPVACRGAGDWTHFGRLRGAVN